jgi:hypothetical protein
MNRKKFFALFSTSIVGAALLNFNPLNLFRARNASENSVKVKINPNAVSREKSGKKNG